MTIICLWEALNDLHVLAKITPNRQLEKGIISLSDQGAVLMNVYKPTINSCLRVHAAHHPACSAPSSMFSMDSWKPHTVYRNCEPTHTHTHTHLYTGTVSQHTHLYTGTMSQHTNLAHYGRKDGRQLYRQIKTSHDGTRAWLACRIHFPYIWQVSHASPYFALREF